MDVLFAGPLLWSWAVGFRVWCPFHARFPVPRKLILPIDSRALI